MKIFLLFFVSSFALIGYWYLKPEKIRAADYVGVWVNPNGSKSKTLHDFIINDRIIIEPKDGKNTYTVSILAKGVFTNMQFNPKNGLLCAVNNACFQLVDKKLRLGSEIGVLTYEREQQ